MRAPTPLVAAGPATPGFVLVGVVIFILALTILGLSLFGLSSYEAQFLGHSRRSTQVLYDAMGGIEWAKMVLTRESRLEAVANGAPAAIFTRPEHVIWVEALQNGDTTGGLAYGPLNPIRIRALADDGRGISRLVEVQFIPNSPDSSYRALVDSYGNFSVPDSADGTGRRDQVRLYGPVRVRNDTHPDWRDAPGLLLDWGRNAPQPRIDDFIAQHWTTADTVAPQGSGLWRLEGSATGVSYFKTGGANVSVLEGFPTPRIEVSGTCVWMLDRGIRVNSKMQVVASGPNARLVIVAKRIEALLPQSTYKYFPPPYIGIWFRGGLDSPVVPVVLVSDSQVFIETLEFTTTSSTIEDLTVFADGVRFVGPDGTGIMRLVHDGDTDAIVQELASMGALPGFSGSFVAFQPIPGTWRELDPDNPDPS